MVWYHGGAFSYGSANQPRTDGTNLAKRGDVVVVNDQPSASTSSAISISLSLAAPSLRAPAMPARSTCSLRSNGCATTSRVSVAIPATSRSSANPAVAGKSRPCSPCRRHAASSHRAIIQSGAATRLRERDRAAQITEAVLKELGLGKADLATLQTLPVERLIAAIGPAQKAVRAADSARSSIATISGRSSTATVLPAHPFDPGATDLSDDVPVIVGGMKDEMAIFLAPDDKIWQRDARRRRAEGARAARRRRGDRPCPRDLSPAPPGDERGPSVSSPFLTDSNFRIRSLLLAERKAAKGKAPVYLYSFDWETPVFDGRLKAFHALDVPFTFDTIDFVGATDRGSAAHLLAAAMSGTWAQFARTGKPDNPAIPAWPAFITAADRATMILDEEWRVASDHGRETRVLWQEITRS